MGTRYAVCSLAVGLSLFTASGASAAIPLPDKGSVEKVDFERHVMGLFGRMGCNAGSCHGSFQGKGGFRLSLFGYEPERDYLAITRDVLGRRINTDDPDRSLLLLKATGQMATAAAGVSLRIPGSTRSCANGLPAEQPGRRMPAV